MQSEGFGHLEESFPALLSELLQTVATVDDDGGLLCRKRTGSSNIGLNLMDALESDPRRMRRRVWEYGSTLNINVCSTICLLVLASQFM